MLEVYVFRAGLANFKKDDLDGFRLVVFPWNRVRTSGEFSLPETFGILCSEGAEIESSTKIRAGFKVQVESCSPLAVWIPTK
jgi:hypothetical protein